MMAESAPMKTTTAAIVPSVPCSAHSRSSTGITPSAAAPEARSRRGIAAIPIRVTTRVVIRGMKAIQAKDCESARPVRAA